MKSLMVKKKKRIPDLRNDKKEKRRKRKSTTGT